MLVRNGGNDAERSIGLQDHRLDLVDACNAIQARGLLHFGIGDALAAHGIVQHPPVPDIQCRLRLDEICHALPADAEVGDDKLERDEQDERHEPLNQGDISAQENRRDRGTQSDGDHKVERVQLREGPLSRHAEHREQCRVAQDADNEGP